MSIKVVIRSANERTLKVCQNRVRSESEIIQVTPFWEAVKKTFAIGSISSEDLLLALDADVLLKESALQEIEIAWQKQLKQDSTLFRLDFLVEDKFRGRVYAGCHLYNNRYSAQVLDFLEHQPYNSQEKRPESTNLALFRKLFGLTSRNNKKLIVGEHDYEQYYHHLFVKYYNRAIRDNKSYDKIYNMILKKWRKDPNDFDYQIALEGMKAAKKEFGTVCTDALKYRDIAFLMEKFRIKEKEPLERLEIPAS